MSILGVILDAVDTTAGFIDKKVVTKSNVKLGMVVGGTFVVARYGGDVIEYVGDAYTSSKEFIFGLTKEEVAAKEKVAKEKLPPAKKKRK